MFLHVVSVSYLKDYELRLEFDNGVLKDVDLKAERYGEVFEPLRNVEMFRRVAVSPDTATIEWANVADFAPEFLYEIGHEVGRTAEAAA